jgi:hypothetical protein
VKPISVKPTKAQSVYLLAMLDGEEYKTTPQARSRIEHGCYDKGLLTWDFRERQAMVVTARGRQAVGR